MTKQNDLPTDLVVDLAKLDQPESVKAFERAGCLKVTDFLPVDKVARLAKKVMDQIEADEAAGKFEQVGDQRIMTAVPVKGDFNDPSLFDCGPLSAFLTHTLGAEHVISCFTCVTSSPGAPSQHQHRDFWPLFNNQIDYFAPSFGINLFIPLVALNDRSGTTRMWPTSHRNPGVGLDPIGESGVYPRLSIGDALVMDYGVLHEGTPNLSDHKRPILCIAFTRPWFLDTRNFNSMAPLLVPVDTFDGMDRTQRALFSRAKLYENFGT